MEADRQHRGLDALERDIRRLHIEFTRFFAGDRERPPLELKEELGARIRKLRTEPRPSTVEQFRLSSLTARLSSQSELSERRMRQHRTHANRERQPTDGVVAGSERGSGAIRRLYQELYKQDSRPANMDAFQSFLEKKVTEIQSRTGCSSVQFRVIDIEGKRSLKAKPIGRLGKA